MSTEQGGIEEDTRPSVSEKEILQETALMTCVADDVIGAGTVLSERYVLLQELGRGAMGVV